MPMTLFEDLQECQHPVRTATLGEINQPFEDVPLLVVPSSPLDRSSQTIQQRARAPCGRRRRSAGTSPPTQ